MEHTDPTQDPQQSLPPSPDVPAAHNGQGVAAGSGASDYGADKIKVLEGLEAVRKRPAMYIGSTGPAGLHHLVYEVVDNSVDEALAGYAKKIDVTIHVDNSITVVDDGRGIPVDMMDTPEGKQMPAVQVVLTKLHAGGKFDSSNYKVSGGLHGVGVSCVNALAQEFNVEIWRDGHTWEMDFSCGLPTSDLRQAGKRVVCHLEDATGSQFYACAGADAILIDPAGSIRLLGAAADVLLFGRTLRKIGLRADEVATLTLDDIDWRAGCLFVPRADSAPGCRSHQTSAQRSLPTYRKADPSPPVVSYFSAALRPTPDLRLRPQSR